MAKKIILLGGNPLNIGFLDVKERNQSLLHIVDWNESLAWAGADKHIREDVKDKHLVEKLDLSDLFFCFSSADVAAYNVARINQAAGLMGPTEEAIRNSTDKSCIYKCFKQAGVLGRDYLELNDQNFDMSEKENLSASVAAYLQKNKNIVVKPANNASSRGVSILKNTNHQETMKVILETYAEFKDVLLLDRYIGGTEYSVEMLVDKDGEVTVWPIGLKCKSQHGTTETVSVKVVYNSFLEPEIEKEIRRVAVACAQSTGLRCSLAHLEVKVEDGRVYPMEIGGRSTGFVATHLVDMVSNHRYLESYAKIIRGEKMPSPVVTVPKTSVYFFYDFPDGKVIADFSKDIDPFMNSHIKTHYGFYPRFPMGSQLTRHRNDDGKKCLRILLADKKEDLVSEIEKMEQEFYSRVLEV